MDIKFLGTGAGELYPNIWCECEYCAYAREHGGKNLRLNSSIHFADNCLIDFPADMTNKARAYGLDILRTRLLLITHSHEDHFNPKLFMWRQKSPNLAGRAGEELFLEHGARFTDVPNMRIVGNRAVFEKLMTVISPDIPLADYAIDFLYPTEFELYHHAGVDFIAMPANHIDEGNTKGMIYWVQAQGKRFLYATVSGTYAPRTRAFIRTLKVDAVIMEGTYGDVFRGNGHMSFESIYKEVDFFKEAGIFTGAPAVYLTHMSPHRMPPYDLLVPRLQSSCIRSAYDGMTLTL